MDFSFFVLILTLFFFILASIEDIKKREVYDYLNFAYAFIILIIAIFDSLLNYNPKAFMYVSFGFILSFAFASLLYYLGFWGGGDAKFLIGFGASLYYLLPYIEISSLALTMYSLLSSFFQIYLSFIFEIFLQIIQFIDLIFILIGFIAIFKVPNKEKKGAALLTLVLLLLFLGIYLEFETSTLLFIGLLSFILLFFAPEDSFSSIYFSLYKNVEHIKESDIIDEKIFFGRKLKLSKEALREGINYEQLDLIKTTLPPTKQLKLRKVLPYSSLISLNYVIYLLSTISINITTVQLLFFLGEFLFYSFIFGGFIALATIFFQVLKHIKTFKLHFVKSEKQILIGASIIFIILGILSPTLLILLILIPLYIAIKTTKQVEKFAFIRKKPLSQITFGDWIMQDIKVNNQLIYSQNQFKLGVSEKQLNKIQKLAKQHKHLRNLSIKEGLPFLPPMFLAFILLLLI